MNQIIEILDWLSCHLIWLNGWLYVYFETWILFFLSFLLSLILYRSRLYGIIKAWLAATHAIKRVDNMSSLFFSFLTILKLYIFSIIDDKDHNSKSTTNYYSWIDLSVKCFFLILLITFNVFIKLLLRFDYKLNYLWVLKFIFQVNKYSQKKKKKFF
jgi:hypothetical protein